MTNRNPVKQLFITFPHSTVDKQEFRDMLLRFEPDYYKICEEKHKDGSPHLHAVIRFKNKYSQSFIIKYFKEVLPDDYKRIDVKPVRSIKNSIAYVSKEDENPLESGSYSSNRNPQRNQLDKFARELGYSDSVSCGQHQVKIAEYQDKLYEFGIKYFKDLSWIGHGTPSAWELYVCVHCETLMEEQIFKKFFNLMESSPFFPILKDDITFIANKLNFPLNYP